MTESVDVIIRQPGFPDRIIPVKPGRTRMGRADDNEIVLADVGVSRRHAQIVLEQGRLSIEDLGSGNGTYYFGHRIKSQPIRDGDEVVIDPFVLQFRVAGEGDVPAAGLPTVPSPELEDGPRLEVVVGNGTQGNVFPILDRGLTMGRAEDRDVVLPDAASSRHHCHINLENGEYVLHDNGSANGVFVNAVRVRECTLSDGDLIRVGNTELRFTHPGAPRTEEHASWASAEDIPSEPALPEEFPSSASLPRPSRSRSRVKEEESGSRRGVFLGAAIFFVLFTAVTLMVVLGAVALGLWFTAGGPSVPRIEPVAPRWTLALPPKLPESDTASLFAEGSQAAQSGDYRLALEDFYRVLSTDPGNRPAKKFAAFTAEVLVATQLQRELTLVEDERLKREARRRKLIDRAKNSRNPKIRANAKRDLTKEFREDPVAREAMNWKLTSRQLGQEELLDRAIKHVKTDELDEAIRLCRKLLDDTREPELRDQVLKTMKEAKAKQARAVAETWRGAVLAEGLRDDETAAAGFKEVIKQNPENVSATLHLQRMGNP